MHILNKPMIKVAGFLLIALALFLVLKPEKQKTPVISSTFEQEENHEHHDNDEKEKQQAANH